MALSFISINAMAFEGQGFKIISERITKSPGFIGGFQEVAPKKKSLYISALSWAYDARGRVMDYVRVQGDHNVSISNETNQTQRYTYTYILSCESAYENFERTIDIYPHGNFIDSSSSYGEVQEEETGSFRIRVATQVSGAESAFHEASAILSISR